MNLEKAYLQENTLDLLLHTYSPEIKVGDRLFVRSRQQTEHVGKRRRGRWKLTALMNLVTRCLVGETGV